MLFLCWQHTVGTGQLHDDALQEWVLTARPPWLVNPWPTKPGSVQAGRHVSLRSPDIRSRPPASSSILPREGHIE